MRGTLKDWAQLILAISAVVGIVVSMIGWSFLRWSEWRDVPARLTNVETSILAFANGGPRLIEFLGTPVVASPVVRQNENVVVLYTLRRTIDCETTIRVRFYDHKTNTYATRYTYDIPAVRSSTSKEFTPFPVPVHIPASLPPGTYSYHPEIIPQKCGIYGNPPVPVSDPFEVVAKDAP